MSVSLTLEAPWNQVKEQLKEIDPRLTDEDLEYEPGKEEELLTRLSTKMGKNADEIRVWIESVSYNDGKAS